MAKEYTITVSRKGRDKDITGDLNYLLQYFKYTLECGHSWNKKIKECPKTIKSFVSNLQKSYEEKEAACFERTFVKLKTEM